MNIFDMMSEIGRLHLCLPYLMKVNNIIGLFVNKHYTHSNRITCFIFFWVYYVGYIICCFCRGTGAKLGKKKSSIWAEVITKSNLKSISVYKIVKFNYLVKFSIIEFKIKLFRPLADPLTFIQLILLTILLFCTYITGLFGSYTIKKVANFSPVFQRYMF